MNNPIVTATQAELKRGGRVIVPSLDLRIERGSLFGLVGPSGSGKTTIMRALLGLGTVSSGEMSLLGMPVGHPDLRLQVGYQPQNGGVWPDLTARESLEFMRRIYRVDAARINDALDLMELGVAANQPVSTLSGGQERRVGLAMAIIHQPQLLILDEPTVGLDPRLRHRLWGEFRKWTDSGTTIIVSTHVMDEAEVCDENAVVMDGRVISVEAPQALISRFRASNMEDAVLQMFEKEAANVH